MLYASHSVLRLSAYVRVFKRDQMVEDLKVNMTHYLLQLFERRLYRPDRLAIRPAGFCDQGLSVARHGTVDLIDEFQTRRVGFNGLLAVGCVELYGFVGQGQGRRQSLGVLAGDGPRARRLWFRAS